MKWSHIVVDYGEQLYEAWRVSEGAILYKDLKIIHGPFSQTLNGLYFSIFGASYKSLAIFNHILLIFLIFLSYRIFKVNSGRISALLSALSIVCIFGFSHLIVNGNYNFITPYAHEATHGIILLIFAFYLLSGFYNSRSEKSLYGAAFVLGLANLTKLDILVTSFVIFILCFFCLLKSGRTHLLKFVLLFFAPLIGSIVYFSVHLGVSDSIWYHFKDFRIMLSGEAVNIQPYQSFTGLDDPADSVRRIAMGLFSYIAIALALLFLDKKFPLKSNLMKLFVFSFSLALLWVIRREIPWFNIYRPIPFLVLFFFLFQFFEYRKSKEINLYWILWAVFSILMALKLMLFARVHHYGFYLFLPIYLFSIHWIFKGKNRFTELAWGQICAMAFILISFYINFKVSDHYYQQKTATFGPEKISDYPQYPGIQLLPSPAQMQATLNFMQKNVPSSSTFATYYAGSILNFYSRKTNNISYPNFYPLELATFTTSAMIQNLKKSPPDYFIFGNNFFPDEQLIKMLVETKYVGEIKSWFLENYDLIQEFRTKSPKVNPFALQIYQYRGKN